MPGGVAEYAAALGGRRMFAMSHGLLKRTGVDEIDEQAEAERQQGEFVPNVAPMWRCTPLPTRRAGVKVCSPCGPTLPYWHLSSPGGSVDWFCRAPTRRASPPIRRWASPGDPHQRSPGGP